MMTDAFTKLKLPLCNYRECHGSSGANQWYKIISNYLTLSIQSMSVRHGARPDTSGGSGDPPKVFLAFKCIFR